MNCPECHELVGQDQYAWGPWREQGPADAPSAVRSLFVHCDHCGDFEATVGERGRVLHVAGPRRGEHRIRRVRDAIPAIGV